MAIISIMDDENVENPKQNKKTMEAFVNTKHTIGITLFNFISSYYDQFENGLKKYIDHESWKIKYKETVKDARVVLCLVDELSIKYSDCIRELTDVITVNQVVIFVNVRRYPDHHLPEDSKQVDISVYLEESKLRFNWRVLNTFIPDECISTLSSYVENQKHIPHNWNKVTEYDRVLNIFKEWLICISETNTEFLAMPRMISLNEMEEYISVTLGPINENVATLLENMMKNHTEKTEELIETVIGRILKEKFEALSEKLQKKYEEEIPTIIPTPHTSEEENIPAYEEIVKPINDEMEIVNNLEYIIKTIEKYNLNIYPNLPSLQNISDPANIENHVFTDEDISIINKMISVMNYIDKRGEDEAWKFITDYYNDFLDYKDIFNSYGYKNQMTDNSLTKAGVSKIVDIFRLSSSNSNKGYIYNTKGWWVVFREFVKSTGFKFIK